MSTQSDDVARRDARRNSDERGAKSELRSNACLLDFIVHVTRPIAAVATGLQTFLFSACWPARRQRIPHAFEL
jgi:hypothetical protein